VWAITRFPMFCPNDQVIPQGNDRRLRRGHPGDEVRTPDTAAGDRAQLAPPPSGVTAALTRTAADSPTVRLRAWSSAVLATKIEGKMAGGPRGSTWGGQTSGPRRATHLDFALWTVDVVPATFCTSSPRGRS